MILEVFIADDDDDKPCVSDVILPDVSMEPVGEVKILVIHADDDVSHHARHLRENPPFNLYISCTLPDAESGCSFFLPLYWEYQ